MSADTSLILLETSGDPGYIFSSDRLRDNLGAAQLALEAGTRFLIRAVHDVGGANLGFEALEADEDPLELLARTLTSPRRNPPLETPQSPGVEVVVATFGRALALARSRETAREVVARATETALRDAPGLDLAGAIEDFEWGVTPFHEALRRAQSRLEEYRARRPSPLLRFPRLPCMERCSSTGLPAETTDHRRAASAAVEAQRRASAKGLRRLEVLARQVDPEHPVGGGPDQLELGLEGLDWMALVHSEGNSLEGLCPSRGAEGGGGNRACVDTLRRLSLGLEAATRTAFREAWRAAPHRSRPRGLPVLPLLVGGGRLTFLCDGFLALALTAGYLEAFPRACAAEPGVREVLKGGRPPGACAGVALMKPRFPRYTAYGVAEELLRSARRVERPPGCSSPTPELSALDFQVLYDPTADSLHKIREARAMTRDGEVYRLSGGPYLVGEDSGHDNEWMLRHRWSDLVEEARLLSSLGTGTSSLQELLAGLHLDRQEAGSRLQQALERHPALRRVAVSADGSPSLFHPEPTSSGKEWRTNLVDALEAAAFLEVPS